MNLNIEQVEFFLFIAAIVAMVARLIKIPYTIGLVIAGLAIAFIPFSSDVGLSKELIFVIFLPALVFEAAFYIRWQELKEDFLVVLTLATVGVLLSAGVIATGMHYLAGWSWQIAMVFGILITATDPVAVIATFKETGVEGRLRLLVEAESLFNDSTAAVGFGIAVAFAMGQPTDLSSTVMLLVTTIGGGILSGAIVAGGLLLLAGQTEDPLVEITFTTVAAYGSFFLAEYFHCSGVLASLTAGLMVGNLGSLGSISDRGRKSVEAFWEYATFVVNSLIFILIGIQESQESFGLFIVPIVIAIAVVLLGRALAIYPLCALFSWSDLRIKMTHQHALFWGGLRGALALALALGLPVEIPHRTEIITVTFGVVAFSVFVQGLTMQPMLKAMGEIPDLTQ
ncbi:cation:proton antiporter [Pseudanabaena mucicola]|uniref:Sodium:proton antiporter n=1 Tax=Pseudanabaena mucicola FACHB-723 TaxID=2692860 RepID=A0ABR7ZWZ1_9CYAN|nr:sodium:proton antiporter [Pseudanabaena mucicola]MBD2188483.1 sodium:proton antiporter [Pseudanabaena mucicola FACHB-723]